MQGSGADVAHMGEAFAYGRVRCIRVWSRLHHAVHAHMFIGVAVRASKDGRHCLLDCRNS